MKNGNFEIGDKVRFVDNELNRAEIGQYLMNKTYTVFAVRKDLLELKHKPTFSCYYHISRFELVPAYQVGDWVKIAHIGNAKLTGLSIIADQWDFATSTGGKGTAHSKYFTRKLSPAEVVLDFRNGIKGTISYDCCGYIKVTDSEGRIHSIVIAALTDPMKTIVTELLKAQEEA